MRFVGFVSTSDPQQEPRVGALLDDGETLVDLQAAHFAMYEAPHPALVGPEAYRAHPGGQALAHRVVAWAQSQRPPGVLTRRERVRLLDERL